MLSSAGWLLAVVPVFTWVYRASRATWRETQGWYQMPASWVQGEKWRDAVVSISLRGAR